ncbi:MAG: hypothetical protein GY871_04060 [Actinomycetales bacterium]|nr:hypothetical protein [Actinomycetales bacterium]
MSAFDEAMAQPEQPEPVGGWYTQGPHPLEARWPHVFGYGFIAGRCDRALGRPDRPNPMDGPAAAAAWAAGHVAGAEGSSPQVGSGLVELWDPVLSKAHWAGTPAELVESNEGDPEVVEALGRLARGETHCESVGFFWLRPWGTWGLPLRDR